MPSFSPDIESSLAAISPVARAYLIARAAYETEQKKNIAEQEAVIARVTSHDPQPAEPANRGDREQWRAYSAAWHAWYDRNQKRVDAATQAIRERYPDELGKLMYQAEGNMVEHVALRLQQLYPDRFDSLRPVFTAYRTRTLSGPRRDEFIRICVNCPP